MTRPARCDAQALSAWLAAHPAWAEDGDALRRDVAFASYAAAIAFVVAVGFLAERRDHHPELVISWRRVVVRWTTHDAGGVTALDLELAAATDELAP
ncbi:MAG: 4a-hydroxytetrahydrobiopterin dehydratase [Polyangiaceae bacterium]|nr:4a-hydroxytetrahydrobiopterin dehydratase [Polyangiaceae bacterium]